jgi:two-component system sensor histidine kinase TctE
MTLRRRLLLMLLPALAILMILGGLTDYWVTVATTTRAYDRALASTALAIAGSVRVDNERVSLAQASLNTLLSAGRSARFDAAWGDSSMLYSVTGPDQRWIAGVPGFPKPPKSGSSESGGVSFWDLSFQGLRWRVASMKTSTAAGALQISVAETRDSRARTQRVMLFGKLLVDFAELDVTLLLIWIAVYLGLRPLNELTERVERHPSLDMRPFDVEQIPGELRPVILAFNRVLELLQHAAQSQQRFVADAAHQMRTPVAGLLAQIELLQHDPRAAGVAAQIGTLQNGIQQLARSANQMLALARAEPVAGAQQKLVPVALKPLVELLVARHVERAEKAGIDLGAEIHDVSAVGNAWLLEDLLENLIDNALKYTPAGGRVTVRCGADGQHGYLEVEDDGPGIPESERKRVRERFYRRPGATGIGCGLGLAIVDQIAAAHRATFTIGSGENGRGARMRVRF